MYQLILIKERLILFQPGKKQIVFNTPAVFNDSHAVVLDTILMDRSILEVAISPASIVLLLIEKDLWSNDQSKLSILPIMKCVVDDLYITLIFDIFEFVRRQAHDCGSLLSIEVDEH